VKLELPNANHAPSISSVTRNVPTALPANRTHGLEERARRACVPQYQRNPRHSTPLHLLHHLRLLARQAPGVNGVRAAPNAVKACASERVLSSITTERSAPTQARQIRAKFTRTMLVTHARHANTSTPLGRHAPNRAAAIGNGKAKLITASTQAFNLAHLW
jgi:hypothetical protein